MKKRISYSRVLKNETFIYKNGFTTQKRENKGCVWRIPMTETVWEA